MSIVSRTARSSRVRTIIEACAPYMLAAGILVGWQIAVPVIGISEFVLPTPWSIVQRIAAEYPLLLKNAYVTILEVLFGYAVAVLAGIFSALAIFYSRAFERAVYPLLVALQTVPKVTLAPLLVLYFGYDWAPKVVLAFLI